jgi:CPA1 family monovalent cation:H+ antiporter
MTPQFVETALFLLLLAVALAGLARRFAILYPIVLVVGGLLLGLVPGLPDVRLDPDLVFLVFLPPILYSAAVSTSFTHLRANARPIALLAVGLVLTTMAAVAVVAHAIVPRLPWAAAFALGAIVSPPDAVAATAIVRRLGLPQRVVTILEGESLVNDATALVAYRMALAALVTGGFSLWQAGWQFLVVAAGGVLVGLASGWVAGRVRRRVDDPPTQITLSLLTPYAAYLPAEAFGLSGVLAVVTAGLWIGGTRLGISPATRLQTFAVWDVVNFLLNAWIFILIGLQLRGVIGGLSDVSASTLIASAAAVSATAIVVRILWVYPATYLPRLASRSLRERDPYPDPRAVAVIAWTGMRGVVSLAAALALPFTLPGGRPFEARDLIVFLTFAVILVTLVLQGLTLPPLLRRLGLARPDGPRIEERRARLEAARAALARLDELMQRDGHDRENAERLRWRYDQRRRRLERETDLSDEADCARYTGSYEPLRRQLLEAERTRLRRLHEEGAIGDDVMLRLDRELVIEEAHTET